MLPYRPYRTAATSALGSLTPAVWRMHAKINLGLRAAVEAVLHDTYCFACLMDFLTVDLLLQHLQAGQVYCGYLFLEYAGQVGRSHCLLAAPVPQRRVAAVPLAGGRLRRTGCLGRCRRWALG